MTNGRLPWVGFGLPTQAITGAHVTNNLIGRDSPQRLAPAPSCDLRKLSLNAHVVHIPRNKNNTNRRFVSHREMEGTPSVSIAPEYETWNATTSARHLARHNKIRQLRLNPPHHFNWMKYKSFNRVTRTLFLCTHTLCDIRSTRRGACRLLSVRMRRHLLQRIISDVLRILRFYVTLLLAPNLQEVPFPKQCHSPLCSSLTVI